MKKRIQLQQRDRDLFKRLSEYGFLTTNQIANFVFKAPYKQTARRLKLLREAGFVGYVTRRDFINSRVYIPDPKGLEGVVDYDLYALALKSVQNRPWFRSLHEHEDTVREMALRIQNAYPEATIDLDHQLKPTDLGIYNSDELEARRKLPDFVVRIFGRRPIWVEVELTQKSEERYTNIFYNFYNATEKDVLYLCRDEKLKEKLKSIRPYYNQKQGQARPPRVLFFELREARVDGGAKAIIECIVNPQ